MTGESSVSSPCNRVCVVHPTARICVGCGRSLDEVARWAALSESERRRVMAQLPARIAALNGAEATPIVVA